MFRLWAEKNRLTVEVKDFVTSGSVNVYPVSFNFDENWEGLDRTAVFRAGDCTAAVLLDGSSECILPWEVLRVPRRQLFAGVYGTRNGEVVLPTVWADMGLIMEGTSLGPTAMPPSPGLYEQLLETIHHLNYDIATNEEVDSVLNTVFNG